METIPEWRLKPSDDGGYLVQRSFHGHWRTVAFAKNEDEGRAKVNNLNRPSVYI